jgi:RNA polymerase sigma factor (sigma-70 family)
MDRVACRIDALQARYSGECASYLYGVARNVYLESLRRQSAESRFREAVRAVPPENASAAAERARHEREQGCLDRCLAELGEADRALVSAYYQSEASGRPARRRALADQQGLTAGNLRQRSHRLRERLRACLARCLAGSE